MRDLVGTNVKSINILQMTSWSVPIHKTFPWRKWTKCGQRTIKTLINNSFIKERVILPFEWTICAKQSRRHTFFDRRSYRTAETINILQATCWHLPIQRTFPCRKIDYTWVARYRNLNKQFAHQEMSISTIWMNDLCQIEPEISFFRLGHGMLQTRNISQTICWCERNTKLFLVVS